VATNNENNNRHNEGLSTMSIHKNIPLSQIVWIHANNPRPLHEYYPLESGDSSLADLPASIENPDEYEYKETPATKNGLVHSLFYRGWDNNQNIQVYPITDELQEIADEQTRERIRECLADEKYVAVGLEIAETHGYIIVMESGQPTLSDKAGRKFKFVATTGNRRSSALYGANVLARMLDNEPRTWTLPCIVNETSHYIETLQENLLKDIGTVEFSENALCMNACILLELDDDLKESDLVKLGMKRGQAQRAYWWAILNQQYPSLNLKERFALPVPAIDPETKRIPYSPSGYIDVSSIHKDAPRKLGDVIGKYEFDEDKPNLPAMAESAVDVESHIEARMSGEMKTPASLSRADQTAVIKTASNRIVSDVLQSVLNKDKAKLKKLAKMSWQDMEATYMPKVAIDRSE